MGSTRRTRPTPQPNTIVYVAVADHYEPYGGKAPREVAHRRLERWMETYPAIAAEHRDSVGRHPCHTFFYPIEEYDPEAVSYTHLRAHETPEHLVCRLLLEKK